MEIGIIGAGTVGQTLAQGLQKLGHKLRLGVREVSNDSLTKARSYAETLSDFTARTGIPVADFASVAKQAEVVVNATGGEVSLAALTQAGAANLAGKVLIDAANPLDFSRGFPPALTARYTGHTSLGEEIQATFPKAKVVKAFNTIAAPVMIDPASIPGTHDLFLAGNDDGKALVRQLAEAFGWKSFTDLGDITGARAMEGILPLWLRLYAFGGSPLVNLHVVR